MVPWTRSGRGGSSPRQGSGSGGVPSLQRPHVETGEWHPVVAQPVLRLGTVVVPTPVAPRRRVHRVVVVPRVEPTLQVLWLLVNLVLLQRRVPDVQVPVRLLPLRFPLGPRPQSLQSHPHPPPPPTTRPTLVTRHPRVPPPHDENRVTRPGSRRSRHPAPVRDLIQIVQGNGRTEGKPKPTTLHDRSPTSSPLRPLKTEGETNPRNRPSLIQGRHRGRR